MACIACEEVPKRINNIYRDDELKEKFENITGIAIYQNLFLCDPCSFILNQSYAFKEKCIEVYERDLIKYEPCQSTVMKTEIYDEHPEIEEEYLNSSINDSQVIQEEHLDEEENEETIIIDPLLDAAENSSKPRVRLRYTLKEKLKAIDLAERTTNRQAAKVLTIDESCIRKWRQQKEQIRNNGNQEACKITKKSLNIHQESQEMDCDTEIECEIQTEVVDETMVELKPVKEVRTRKSYSSGEKLEVVAFAEVTGNRQAAKIFKIDESCIRKWRNQKELLIEINQERGTRRKPNLRFPDVESRLKAFVLQKLNEGIVLKPSEIKAESIRIAEELNITNFKGTSSYIFKFMERYHFPSSSRGKGTKSAKKIIHDESVDITVVDIL
ncbi:unnamed protein product [Chironomus riparius]|uniref:HTH CENPB-type domain-containing protein n=1 Tax=Chironomus riparius TaxID=315576 RepID=A0A9N9S6C9_9DIPT|nr:unnamed protein product [Chironomus riparius]